LVYIKRYTVGNAFIHEVLERWMLLLDPYPKLFITDPDPDPAPYLQQQIGKTFVIVCLFEDTHGLEPSIS